MNINIIRSAQNQSILRMQLWKLQSKPNIIYIITTFIFGCLCLSFDYTNGFFIGVSAFMLLISLFYLVNLIRSRNSILAINRSNAAKLVGGEELIKIVLDDTGIKYKASEFKQDFNWSLVKYYKIVDTMILLMPSKSYLSSYVVYKSELTKEDYFELEKFLKTNIQLKK